LQDTEKKMKSKKELREDLLESIEKREELLNKYEEAVGTNLELENALAESKSNFDEVAEELSDAYTEVENLLAEADALTEDPAVPESVTQALVDLRREQDRDLNLNSSATALLKGKIEILEELFVK